MDFQTFRFIAIAAILYGAFHFAYHKVPDEVLSTKIYPNVIGHFAASTINTLTPDRNVTVKDARVKLTHLRILCLLQLTPKIVTIDASTLEDRFQACN